MSSVQITEVNAPHFLQAIEDAVRNGYYVDTSIEGYPQLGFPLQVRLFEGEAPELRFLLKEDVKQAEITEWDGLTFLLNVQSAILQGFEIDVSSVVIGAGLEPHSAVLTRHVQEEPVVFDLTPNVQETAAEEVVEPQEEEKPAKGKTRKQKSKEE